MTDTMTSQNIDLSSWDTLYRPVLYPGGKVAILQLTTFFPISNRRISIGLYRLSFCLCYFNDVTYEVAKEARCTP
jgi:hypothetical protein